MILLALFLIAEMPQATPPAQKPAAEEPHDVSQEEIRKIVRECIQDKSATLTAPQKELVPDALIVTPAARVNQATFPPKPYSYPLQTQFLVEASRDYIPKGLDRAEWDAALVKIEAVTAQQLRLISSPNNDARELRSQLIKAQAEVIKILKEAYAREAEGRRVDITFPKGAGKYRVNVKIADGKTVYFVTAADYQFLKTAGRLNDLSQWNQIAGGASYMGGNFFFRVADKTGKVIDSGKVSIEKSQTLSLGE